MMVCASPYNDPENAENPFGLVSCDEGDPAQQFVYDDASMEMPFGLEPPRNASPLQKQSTMRAHTSLAT